MFSLTMKTISGEYTYYWFEIRSEKKQLFSVFCRLYFNIKLLEDTNDKDENCWQSFFLSMWQVLEPKISYRTACTFFFFSISVVNKEIH